MDGISSVELDPLLVPVTPPPSEGESETPPPEPAPQAPESGNEVDTYA